MNVTHVDNIIEVSDIDLMDDDACRELGRIVAKHCVVRVPQAVTERRFWQIHMLWGRGVDGIMHKYMGQRKLKGPHWRSLATNMARVRRNLDGFEDCPGLTRVSFEKDRRGKPTGLFSNGELDWHSDRQSIEDAQTVVGLMSLWGTEGSQTAFLQTADAYAALSAEDRSMVDELVTVWAWDGGSVSEDLVPGQMEIVRYNMVPADGTETALVSETAAGVKGIRFPSHSFSHFRGMGREESLKFRDHLWSRLHRPENLYVHDWSDGEMMFFDQNITLHARPTNVQDGDTRTLARMISHMDRIYPDCIPYPHVRYAGERLDHDSFAAVVDAKRREEFYAG